MNLTLNGRRKGEFNCDSSERNYEDKSYLNHRVMDYDDNEHKKRENFNMNHRLVVERLYRAIEAFHFPSIDVHRLKAILCVSLMSSVN